MTGGPNRKLVRLVSESTFPHRGEAERWLPVTGFEGLYEVSDLGRVRSLPRQTVKGVMGGRVLKPSTTGPGYFFVSLHRSNIPTARTVHRLVLEAFVGPCPAGMEACHGRGGQLDNRLANLTWGTKEKNNGPDKVRDGTIQQGEQHWYAKLTDAVVEQCRRRNAAGETHAELAREFGMSLGAMRRAIIGECWDHVREAAVPSKDGLGENHGNAKLSNTDVIEIRRQHAAGESNRVIALHFGVARTTIAGITNGSQRRHG